MASKEGSLFSRFTLPLQSSGIPYMLVAMLLISSMFALSKCLGEKYSPAQLAFLRFCFGLIPLLPLIGRRGISACYTSRPWGHVWRCGFGLSALVMQFYALQHLPFAEATIVQYTSASLIALFGFLFLKEKPGHLVILALVLGFVGIAVLVNLQDMQFNIGLIYALSGAVMLALAMICLRSLGRTETAYTVTLLFTLLSILFTALPCFFSWHSVEPEDWLLFLGMGILGGGGQLAITKAYTLSPAATVAPFGYTSFLWAVVYGVIIWGQVPNFRTLIGAVLVIASGLLVGYSQALGRRKTAS